MRKLLCSLLLPLLLITQQGALVHELSHLASEPAPQSVWTALPQSAPAGDAPAVPPAPHTGHALCGLCLAFAHLAGPLASLPPLLVLLDVHQALAGVTPVAAASAHAPTARSRGPPALL